MVLHISPIHFDNMSFRQNNSSDINKDDRNITPEITDDEIVDDFIKEATEPVSEEVSEHVEAPVTKNVNSPSKNSEIKQAQKDEKTSTKENKNRAKEDKDTTQNKKSVKNFVNNTISKWQQFLKYKARAVEYTKGLATGVVSGLGVGGAILSVDWSMKGVARVAKGEENATIFISEPTKLVTSSFGKVFKGIYNLPNLTIKEIAINTLHSPIDLFKYVKNAKNVSKAGKILAPLAGGAALAYSLAKSVLRANQKVANIEHAFNSGHAHDLK